MDEFLRTVFGFVGERHGLNTTNLDDTERDDEMPGLEPISASPFTPETQQTTSPSDAAHNHLGGTLTMSHATGDSGTFSDSMPSSQIVVHGSEEGNASGSTSDAEEVEMMQDLQPVDDDGDSNWIDTGGTQTPLEAETAAPRRNRRIRVEEDGDDDRDRRHPSHRVANNQGGVNNVSSIGHNNNSNNSSQTQPQPSASQLNPQVLPPPPPHSRRRTTIQIGFGFGAASGPEDARRQFNQLLNGQNARRQTAASGTADPSATGASSGTPGTPGTADANAHPAGATRTFTTGFSVVIDANGNAITTPFNPFPAHPNQPMNVDPATGTTPVPTGESEGQPEGREGEAAEGGARPGLTEGQTLRDIAQRLGILGVNLGLMGQAFGMGMGMEEREDPERAKRLVAGLEEVPEGLVRRLERVGGAPGGLNGAGATEGQVAEGCAICWDKLLDEGESGDDNKWGEKDADNAEGEVVNTSAEENTMANSDNESPNQEHDTSSLPSTIPSAPSHTIGSEQPTSAPGASSDTTKLPKVVCLPCAHVFHASCLIPWFSRPRHTTCPTCRFNVDPENLTYVRRTVPMPRRPTGATAANGAPAPGVNPSVTVTNVDTPVTDIPIQGQEGQPEPGQPPAQPAEANAPQDPNAPPRTFNPPSTQSILLGFDLFFGLPGDSPLGAGDLDMEDERQMDVDGAAAGVAREDIEGVQAGGPQDGEGAQDPTGEQNMQDAFTRQLNALAERHVRAAMRSMFGPLERRPPVPAPPIPTAPTAGSPPPPVAPNGVTSPVPPSIRQFLGGMGNLLPGMRPFPGPAATGPGAGEAGQLPTFAQMFGGIPGAGQRSDANAAPAAGAESATPDTGANPGAGNEETPNSPRQNTTQGPDPGFDVHFGFQTIPLHNLEGLRPRRAPRERKEWTLPPAPGLTLRQRVEQKERDLGLRCYDVSCGIGPSDDDPAVEVDIGMKQLIVRPSGNSRDSEERVCSHAFHAPCLITSQRVALKGAAENVKDGEVEVSCSVCRALGCVLKEEWDAGVQAL